MSEIAEIPSGMPPGPQPPMAVHRAWYRRPVVILPLVLVFIAAVGVALFFVLSPAG
jgi:hypothetical protein